MPPARWRLRARKEASWQVLAEDAMFDPGQQPLHLTRAWLKGRVVKRDLATERAGRLLKPRLRLVDALEHVDGAPDELAKP